MTEVACRVLEERKIRVHLDTANNYPRVLQEGIVLAEIFSGMNDRNLFGLAPDRDPLHPNDQGYRAMANI